MQSLVTRHCSVRIFEGTPETNRVDLVARDFARAEKNNGDIVVVEFAQIGVVINIHFAQRSAEFAENRENRGACLIAETAFRPRVKRRVARLRDGKASLFAAPVNISAARGIEMSRANEQLDRADHVFAARRIVAARDLHQGVKVERFAA